MFGKPQSPVDPDLEEWIEWRLSWLEDKFGLDPVVKSPTITPTEQFFPLRLDTEDGARKTFGLVCGYMGVEPGDVQLEFIVGDKTRHFLPEVIQSWKSNAPAGTWDNSVAHRIRINRDTLTDSMAFVATVAHELGHEILIGKGLMTGDEDDHEPLTDLLTVYFGLGIFGANSVIHFRQFQDLAMQGHEWSRRGYLSMEEWAYGLAHYACARDEEKPKWLAHLRPDARALFMQSMKYLTNRC